MIKNENRNNICFITPWKYKKVLDVMAYSNDIDLLKISEAKKTDFSVYDAIGFASGIYFHKFHKGIEKLASEIDLTGKKVFTVYTCGINYINYARGIQKQSDPKTANSLEDSAAEDMTHMDFFEKIGGIAKNHPNEKDFRKAREFIKNNLR